MSTMAPQITSLFIVYLTVYSGTDKKHQSSSNAENVSIWWRHNVNLSSWTTETRLSSSVYTIVAGDLGLNRLELFLWDVSNENTAH